MYRYIGTLYNGTIIIGAVVYRYHGIGGRERKTEVRGRR